MTSVTNLSDEAVIERFDDFCKRVNTTLARQASNAVRQSPEVLKSLLPDPGLYDDVESFALDWQIYCFLKKFKGLPGTSLTERRLEARRGWSAAERANFHTNVRLSAILHGDCSLLDIPIRVPGETTMTMATVISTAQRKIESVLGPFNWKKLVESCNWSSGATVDLPRGTQLSKKMTERITVTERALPYLKKVLARDIGWMAALTGRETLGYASPLDLNFSIVRHSRFLTVPKSAFTERCINAEPTGNAFLQQGVGRFLRSRLKRVCIDLDDQSFNQWMAGKAYTHGYSTLDLQSASDTVSIQLVKLLLPQRWFEYLDSIRTPFSKDGKKITKVEKFSSMGNAFTFELESLIFWALAQSVNELLWDHGGMVAVFGDDIVCKRALFDPLVDVLRFCGFTVNTKKSYKDGNFFESCGANYFMGADVTGFHLEDSLSSLDKVISFHNKALRWSIRIFGTPFSKVAKALVSDLPDGVHKIPFTDKSDRGFLTPTRDLGRFDPNRGYLCKVLLFVPDREVQYKQAAFYAYKLRRRQYQNADPRGQPMVTILGRGRWISAQNWVQRWE